MTETDATHHHEPNTLAREPNNEGLPLRQKSKYLPPIAA